MSAISDVARDLTEITKLAADLEDEAVHHGDDPEMPGGDALAALAGVASPSVYAGRLDNLEEAAIAFAFAHGLDPTDTMPGTPDEDDWEPPLQTLLFWSEAWRMEQDWAVLSRPTITTEANFIRASLDWAWETELHWDDFARDIRQARARLENLLYAGQRVVARGVCCLYDECGGARLVRKTVPTAGTGKDKGKKLWRLTDWHCPRCHRSWDERAYASHVYAAIERTHWEDFDGEVWCTISRAARSVGRNELTIRTWVERGQVRAACQIGTHRLIVSHSDVAARDRLAKERHARRIAAMAANSAGQVYSPS